MEHENWSSNAKGEGSPHQGKPVQDLSYLDDYIFDDDDDEEEYREEDDEMDGD